MRLLDLFCGAGGAAVGYHRAGFDDIVGVDIKPQPRYPFTFVQADALEYVREHGREFDVIHASPPCQAFTALKTAWNARQHLDLLSPTRAALDELSLPYVIENVPGATMYNAFVLCGTMVGLKTKVAELRRHRLFESNVVYPLTPPCYHGGPVVGVYGGHGRDRRRAVTVTSKGGWYNANAGRPSFPIQIRQEAMGIDWMTEYELSQAIPPAYTEFIGRQLLGVLV